MNTLGGVSGLATPCHPITGATNTMGAAPLGATSTAFPGTTTFEQTSGIPANTHMYGVPVATFEKTGPTKRAPAIPLATATTGVLGSSAPITTTTVESHVMPVAPGMAREGIIDSQTFVSESFTPVATGKRYSAWNVQVLMFFSLQLLLPTLPLALLLSVVHWAKLASTTTTAHIIITCTIACHPPLATPAT